MRIKNVEDVAAWRLCLGCGACAYGCPEKKVTLADILDDGIRPSISGADRCGPCRECLDMCPGYGVSHDPLDYRPGVIAGLRGGWGPVLEVWEGYAAGPDIRHMGSSGGVVSALAIYCLENEGMAGVLHAGADAKEPWRNRTAFSSTRAEVLSNTGSRYSPASPCDGLGMIEDAASPCVFIGKPCDVAGLSKARKKRPGLERNTGLAIGIFCAGTPSSMGTLKLLGNFDIRPENVSELRYRGRGWPGKFTVRMKKGSAGDLRLSYPEAWGFLQKFRPLRCRLCPDGTSEFADISCGDAWHREANGSEEGQSIVLVRTERGRRIIRSAMETGYLSLARAGPGVLRGSQNSLLDKRRAIWGRLLAMGLFNIPRPRLAGFELYANWKGLDWNEKARSVLGTVKRILKRRYFKRAGPA